jgi:predicted metal-dependent hydrolase
MTGMFGIRSPFFRIRVRVRRGLRGDPREYRRLKEEARAFVHERLHMLNQHYGFAYKRVAIRNSSSRWGSCSQKGNLNFHYKLLQLPPELADYIIVHELCHLAELNHSERFWSRVAEVIPDWKVQRKRLSSWARGSQTLPTA